MTLSRRSTVALYRILMIIGPVVVLESLCRAGLIRPLMMPAPTIIIGDLWVLVVSGRIWSAFFKTMGNVLTAAGLGIAAGTVLGAAIHRWAGLRRVLDPLFATYYAVPIFAFYPLLIVLFGLGDVPQIMIGFMLAVVAVVVSTLHGLDSVPTMLLKTARIHRMGPVETAWRVTLPHAAPQLLTGVKLALAYAFVGVIGAEFIMSRDGLGYEINFAFNNFDNAVMYPLILLILLLAVGFNLALDRWEKRLLARRGRH